jgi:hypothetical protein
VSFNSDTIEQLESLRQEMINKTKLIVAKSNTSVNVICSFTGTVFFQLRRRRLFFDSGLAGANSKETAPSPSRYNNSHSIQRILETRFFNRTPRSISATPAKYKNCIAKTCFRFENFTQNGQFDLPQANRFHFMSAN